jgi:hypothetical protein
MDFPVELSCWAKGAASCAASETPAVLRFRYAPCQETGMRIHPRLEGDKVKALQRVSPAH